MTTPTPRCPICKADVPPRAVNKAYPFCTNRCRLLDLSAWMNEEYVLSRPIDPTRDAEAIEAALRAGRPDETEIL
ncbi:MAG: DNA gyrase inhibitor YacG [Myxococcales bacterium]|nr:DNA gyrase inhibitor YacG [Myxococcales bacterium]